MLVLGIESFYTKLNNDDLSNRTSQGVVLDQVVINAGIVNWEHRIVKNVVFEKTVVIEKVDLKCGFSFEYCQFNNGIVFNNVEVTKYDESLFPGNASLYFYDCKVLGTLLINNSRIDRAICIYQNSEIDKIEIKNSQAIHAGIRIKDSKINQSLYFKISEVHSLAITNSIIDGIIRFESLIVRGSISFIKSTFNNWIKLWNIDTGFGIIFNKNSFNNKIDITASRIKHGLNIHGDTFNNEFRVDLFDENDDIQESFLEKVFIEEAKFIDRFIINGNNTTIQEFKLLMTPKLQGVIKVNECLFTNVELSGVNEHVKLIFKKILFQSLKIMDFSNLSDVTFSNSMGSETGELEIVDSDMGDTKFNEFSFKSFSKIKLINTFLNKIISTNIVWFDDKQLEVDDNSQIENSQFYRNKREVYRQIKQALRSDGNQIDSLLFQAREMEAYRNELKSGSNYSNGDKLIMSVNQTNNYGLSWWKPTWIITLITFGFYLLMLPLFSDDINYTIAKDGKDVCNTLLAWYDNLDVFWQLFNPARKFSSTYGEIESGWLQFFDLIHRVILGIFIYQIIKGFRKLTSK